MMSVGDIMSTVAVFSILGDTRMHVGVIMSTLGVSVHRRDTMGTSGAYLQYTRKIP